MNSYELVEAASILAVNVVDSFLLGMDFRPSGRLGDVPRGVLGPGTCKRIQGGFSISLDSRKPDEGSESEAFRTFGCVTAGLWNDKVLMGIILMSTLFCI